MREILFRGVCTETGDWVKGHYVRLFDDKGNRYHRIYPGYAESDCGDLYPDWYEVDLETVGQFTGLTDRNDKKIFEGDIVMGAYKGKGVVEFTIEDVASCGCCFPYFVGSGFKACDVNLGDCEVIGNIHDNPELLEKK